MGTRHEPKIRFLNEEPSVWLRCFPLFTVLLTVGSLLFMHNDFFLSAPPSLREAGSQVCLRVSGHGVCCVWKSRGQ